MTGIATTTQRADPDALGPGGLVEIRDYHYRPERMAEYRAWAQDAVPVLADLLDLVGFWIDSGHEPEIMGSEPMNLPLGSANVTWMIRWADMAEREAGWEALWDDVRWQREWERHPGFDDYLHMSVRFLAPTS